jgi:hypothetical protein
MTFARASLVGAAIAAMAVGLQVTRVPSRPIPKRVFRSAARK